MQLGMKGFGKHPDNHVNKAHDNYFQLAYRIGQVWECVENIFDMWDNGEVRGQRDNMNRTQWKHLQGLDDDQIVIPVLQKVVLKIFSLRQMGLAFATYKLRNVVHQAFVKCFYEKNWQTCFLCEPISIYASLEWLGECRAGTLLV